MRMFIIFALISLAVAWVSRDGVFDSPEEADTYKLRRSLLEQMEDVVEYLAEQAMATTDYEDFMEELEEIKENPGFPYIDCAGCRV